ncbi:phosphotransferase [Brassicibacter mesophilus]|uniref:phosphotransferase n=1 Tax=Brassicibacter mesophilus TaxID=745119 RepID=UPI003D19868E
MGRTVRIFEDDGKTKRMEKEVIMMFERNNIKEGILTRPNVMEIKIETINRILLDAGIDSEVVRLSKPNPWVMQSQYIHMSDGRRLLLKVGIVDEWTDTSTVLNQVKATSEIRASGIPQPKILSYSANKNDYGFRFILSESQKGNCLCNEYKQATESERKRIYSALGKAYRLIHSIQNDWAGIWDGDPSKKKYPIHPAEFYRSAEIYNGSNKYLLDNNIISKELYEKICSIWDENLPYMKQRSSSLVHFSPFPWSIYVLNECNNYSVGGLSALGDFMWWDPMIDIAHLLYPPFTKITQEERDAFITKYNMHLEERAINLYILLNRVCAMSGCYLAPVDSKTAKNWIKKEVETIEQVLTKF